MRIGKANIVSGLVTLSVGVSLASFPLHVLAAEEKVVAVADPSISGHWPGLDEAGVAAAVLAGLGDVDGFRVRSGGAAACDGGECWAKQAAALGASHILTTTLAITDSDASVRLEVYGAAGGALLASGESSCEVCADNEVREILSSAAALLRPRIEALGERPTTLVVNAAPPGAVVFVDGRAVGKTPLTGPIEPGNHDIVISAAGYKTHQARRFAEPGETQVVDVVLDTVPKADSADSRPLATGGIVGVTALGVGVGTVAAGIAMTLLDGRPVRSTCGSQGADENDRCPRMYETRIGGIVALSVGAAALLTGAILLALDRRRSRRSRASARLGTVHVVGRF